MDGVAPCEADSEIDGPVTMSTRTVLFVSNASFLQSGGGGVQWCTREYLDTLNTTWNSVATVSFEIDRRPVARIYRRLFPLPFHNLHHPRLIDEILGKAKSLEAEWVFLNNVDAAVLAPRLRTAEPNLKIAYLSHGVELTDVVNNLRLAKDFMLSADRSSQWLGDLIKLEISIRKAVDAVICISDEDRIFEQWLGAARTLFIPRQVVRSRLTLQPVAGRIGTVSTLDHGPNLDGIRQLALELEGAEGIELRLVGGPENMGRELESRFRSIRYLGRLTNAELEDEAATWCVFANPIFCQARGASTKVATALGWGLPVLTTPQGARGYRWDDDALPRVETVKELARLAIEVSLAGQQSNWKARAIQISKLAPSTDESGKLLRQFLSHR